jgi:hypothetical protein
VTVPDERRQFRVLYADFLFRAVDLEVLSAGGEVERLLAQFAAILVALNLTMAMMGASRYFTSTLPHDTLMVTAWGDEEFLISTTMAIAGLFAVMSWNVVLPDRRDSLVLGPLPVRVRTMLLARIAATGTALGIGMVTINLVTGLCYPVAAGNGGVLGALRAFAAYWATMAGGGVFVFCTLLAVQGVAAQIFSYRLFLRVSSFLQLAAFFVVIGGYCLTPPLASVRGVIAPESQRLIAWFPSFWFLGLLQQLSGASAGVARPALAALRARAVWGLLVASGTAAVAYALAYRRGIRRIIEQPDIGPGDRSRPASRAGAWLATRLAAKCLPRPLERAILLFTVRTIGRSRQHRLLLAAYTGAGFAIALAYAKGLVYGESSGAWQMNAPLARGGLVVLCFAAIGVRMAFVLPTALRANWVFRITQASSAAEYFAAVRKAMYTAGVAPVWVAAAIVYLAIWPGRAALEHIAVLALVGIVLVERLLYGFRKIPFTCSYLPGKANLTVTLGLYAIGLLCAAEMGTDVELWCLERPARFVALLAILLAGAAWMHRRTEELARVPHGRIQFEELPTGEVTPLELSDATSSASLS